MPFDAMPHTAQLGSLASCSAFIRIHGVKIAGHLHSGARGQRSVLQRRGAEALSMGSDAGRS